MKIFYRKNGSCNQKLTSIRGGLLVLKGFVRLSIYGSQVA